MKASISKRPFFSNVEIGLHEDKIKEMILSGNPGRETDYPIQVWTTIYDHKFPKNYILQPRMIRLDRHHVYSFAISGLVFMFYVSSHSKSKDVLDHTIKK